MRRPESRGQGIHGHNNLQDFDCCLHQESEGQEGAPSSTIWEDC